MTPNKLKKTHFKIIDCSLEIDKGWYWLVDTLCKQLQFDIDKNYYPQIKFSTVKEKFGMLRTYYHYDVPDQVGWKYDVQKGMIRLAESMSCYICEECGTTSGEIRNSVWLKCLCNECWGKAMK